MDSVISNTPPPEINRCNVLYKDQEYYSPSLDPDSINEYEFDKQNGFYLLLSLSFILLVIGIILIFITIKKYKEKKEIIVYIIGICIIFLCVILLPLSNYTDIITLPNDLVRPCYSDKVRAILYTDEQLKDIYTSGIEPKLTVKPRDVYFPRASQRKIIRSELLPKSEKI